jgi:general secretion pathway protein L
MEYFNLQRRITLQPDYVVLSGPMLLGRGFLEKMESEIGLPCRRCDIARSGAATLSADIAGSWLPALYDTPLVLALRAGNKKKNIVFNFRRDEFARPHQLLRSKKQLAGVALTAGFLFLLVFGYLFMDYKSLQEKHDGLSAKMERVFRKSFPGTDPGRDPLMHMRSKLKEMDTVTVSMPVFSQEKRILVILADISARIPGSIDLHVTRLIIDRDSVKIKGTTDAFNNVNTIKDMLIRSDKYAEVNIVSAAKGKKKEGIRFEIRLRLAPGENS